MQRTEYSTRWYQNRWPWIIIGMLVGTVVMCIHLLVVAIKTQDSLVADNYYDVGKGINRSLEREQLARDLNLRAEVFFDELTGEIKIKLNNERVDALELNLISPTQPQQDLHIPLKPDIVLNGYYGQLPHPISGRRFIELIGHQIQDKKPWRLFEEETIVLGKKLLLGDEPIAGAAAPAP